MFIRATVKDKATGEIIEVKARSSKSDLIYPCGGKWDNFKFFGVTILLLGEFYRKFRKYAKPDKYQLLKIETNNGFILDYVKEELKGIADVEFKLLEESELVEA